MAFSPIPIALPEPQPVRFELSPLALVVCQIRFEHLGLPGEEALQGLRAALGNRYPNMQPMQNVQIQIGPPGAQATAGQGWRFASLDDQWSVAVMPDSVAIETRAYEDWEDLDARLREVLAALADTLAPKVEVRLGLRYVNEIRMDEVTEPAQWGKYLRAELVGLTSGDLLAPAAASAQQVVQVDAGEGARLNIRHGFPGVEEETPPYLLDFDCFREGQRPLDVDALLHEADRFNTMITSLFQWSITSELWEELKPHDK